MASATVKPTIKAVFKRFVSFYEGEYRKQLNEEILSFRMVENNRPYKQSDIQKLRFQKIT